MMYLFKLLMETCGKFNGMQLILIRLVPLDQVVHLSSISR